MKLLSEVMKDIPLPIHVSRGIKIETKTDAYQVVWNEHSLQMYLETFGDVEVEWDSEWKVYRVQAFRAEMEKYTALKAADCKIWGSE